MAAGDYNVFELGRSRVQGGGSSLAGSPKNDKVMIWGQIDFTYATAGLVLTPSRFGLATLDHISVSVSSANNDTATSAAAPFIAVWTGTAETVGNLIITDDAGTVATDNQTGLLTFVAFGSALNADLT